MRIDPTRSVRAVLEDLLSKHSLRQVARMLHVSPSYLSEYCSRTGIDPQELLAPLMEIPFRYEALFSQLGGNMDKAILARMKGKSRTWRAVAEDLGVPYELLVGYRRWRKIMTPARGIRRGDWKRRLQEDLNER